MPGGKKMMGVRIILIAFLGLYLGACQKQEPRSSGSTDVALIGAGIMSATLGSMLKELDPHLKIDIFERLDEVAKESSGAWNNAGTGHAAFAELNYTPELST